MNVKNGNERNYSLRKAKMDFLKDSNTQNSHPFYWASINYYGDTSPLKKESNYILYVLLISGILIGIGWFGIRDLI